MNPNDIHPSLQAAAFMQSMMESTMKSGSDFFEELCFSSILEREKKRCCRTGRTMLLVLVNLNGLRGSTLVNASAQLNHALSSRIRETDFRGWYLQNSVVGILFTDLQSVGAQTRESLFGKTLDALNLALRPEDLPKVYVTYNTLPADAKAAVPTGHFNVDRVGAGTREETRHIAYLAKFRTQFCNLLRIRNASINAAKILGRSKYRVAKEYAEYQQR